MGSEEAVVSERAQAECRRGETGYQETVQEPLPGGGTSYSLEYYCLDEDEERRDVTDEVLTNLFTNPQELLELINLNPLFPAIALGGVLFFIFGLIYRPRREIPAIGTPVSMDSLGSPREPRPRSQSTPRVVVTTKTFDASSGSSSFADLMRDVKAKAAATNEADLVSRLQQLEDARSKGLITQAEYDQMRKDILASMK